MNRIVKCLIFELKYLGKNAAAFIGIYFGIYLILTISLNAGSSTFESNSSFYFAGSIYIFACIAASYKQIANYLLMFGNTRKSMVLSSYITYAAMSVLISIVAVISGFLEKAFAAVNGNDTTDLFALLYPTGPSVFAKLVWSISFFVMIGAFSMLYGSLAYKFGKNFFITFWVASGFLLFFLPAVSNPKNLVNALAAFFKAGSADGAYLACINFLVAAAVFGAGAWIAARRQPQVV